MLGFYTAPPLRCYIPLNIVLGFTLPLSTLLYTTVYSAGFLHCSPSTLLYTTVYSAGFHTAPSPRSYTPLCAVLARALLHVITLETVAPFTESLFPPRSAFCQHSFTALRVGFCPTAAFPKCFAFSFHVKRKHSKRGGHLYLFLWNTLELCVSSLH